MLPAFRALVTRCRVLTETFSNPIGSRIVNRLRTFSAYYAVKATTRTRVLRLISVVMASHSQQGDVADNRLVILHATDIHLAYNNVQRLKEWIKQKNQRVDIVLLSGDFAAIPVECYSNNGPQEVFDEHRQHMEKIVHEFAPLASKVYYIPGNHDAPVTFETENLSTDDFPCNVHLKRVTMAPGLHLLGIGGSVPGYMNGQHHWDGYPYAKDENMAKDLNKLLEPVFYDDSSTLKPEDAVIFMTHCGPDQSDTTYVRLDPANPIKGGSPSLYSHLCNEKLQNHVVINIHGHTHDSPGRVTIGKTVVINPGPLQDGHFGVYTLQSKPNITPSWELISSLFYDLP